MDSAQSYQAQNDTFVRLRLNFAINLDEHLPSKNPIIYFLAVWVFGNLIFFFGYPEFEALPSPYVEKRSYAQPAGNKLRIPLTHSSFHSFDGRNSI